MKQLGFRSTIIILFLSVSIGGLMLLNAAFQAKQEEIHLAIEGMELSERLREIRFYTNEDSLKAGDIMREYDASKALLNVALGNSRLVTSVVLLLVMLASSAIFILAIIWLSKPLRELKMATDQIREGNFSVHLPDTGIREIRELKSSFNVMSRELENIQNKLLVAEKEMIWKDLSRILAHEIKNPLTPIQLVVQRLEERFQSDPDSVKDLLPETISIISQEIENLRLLAQDFSSYAKASQPDREQFNPALVIREIVKSYCQNYSIELNLNDNLSITFDKTHFYQVITNILQNAIDASEDGKPISINLHGEHSYVVLSIKDEGSGIDPADLSRIFEPYFSKKTKGTGLGLALVKKLCEANSAILRVKSKKGEGSEFTIIIEEHTA
ncbi:MAG: HAMP domain-containing sensor histidine kinase [Candidatus Cloacimonetes bacterium]|jgi:two-component system nitrogen regulation sensor histidine kinase NtrY|nr:HAMP domain-containing histidine kinase [Candidatus Cloacimonadota bacterium]MDD2505991.1 HAMP domain-containing sensor histidine kinase [Candidatus Cloacimonadota bacterium]MDD4148245.1 HAMP domain-containing sensor histidine kinase [Candidatus Cloacimonadota bacterium]MDD4559254.1 HAMP domain-containing sensor histidine kinase [Candidatus Cloacimonadota bacterium]